MLQAKNCFVCDRDNPRGLRIPFYFDGESVTGKFVPDDSLCGYDGVVHGGILFSLADEAMTYLLWAQQIKGMTAEATIRYHSFAKVGEVILIEAQVKQQLGRLINTTCKLSGADGEKIATVSGKFLVIKEREKAHFRKIF